MIYDKPLKQVQGDDKKTAARELNLRDFSDLTEIFIFFNARYTKRDAPGGRAVSEA